MITIGREPRFNPRDASSWDNATDRRWHTALSFRNACRVEDIPLETPIPEEALALAEKAFRASCASSRDWPFLGTWETGPYCEDAPALWQAARDALRVRKVA